MTNLSEFTFLSSDGKTQLHGMLWEPEGVAVRAVLQICHGVAEHIARYDGFARALNEQGIAVAGHDHLGHGKSLPEGGTPVYFGQGSTWNTVVDDIYVLHQRIRLWYPDVPLGIMGHSMGSFLTRTYLIRYPGTVKAAIIMGTGWQPKAVIAGGLAVAKAVGAVVGESGTSDLVTKLAFGAYNRLFAPNRTSCDWLSADTDNVDRYMADPMCGAEATVGLFRQMLRAVLRHTDTVAVAAAVKRKGGNRFPFFFRNCRKAGARKQIHLAAYGSVVFLNRISFRREKFSDLILSCDFHGSLCPLNPDRFCRTSL